MKDKEQLNQAIANIFLTYSHVANFIEQTLVPYNLSGQQYAVLRLLSKVYPKSLTMGQLKVKMANQNSDLTRLTDRLLAKNLATREVNPLNRREVNIRLTQESNQFILQVAEEFRDFEAIVGHLTGEEIKTLNNLLDKIRIR